MKGDGNLFNVVAVAVNNVITHDLYVSTVGLQQKVAYDVCSGCQGDAMVYVGMLCEELFQYVVIERVFLLPLQVHFQDLHGWEMVTHVVAEAHLAVCLLLTGYTSFLSLLHKHYLLLVMGYEHEHLGCEVTALKRVLAEERQWFKVRHV